MRIEDIITDLMAYLEDVPEPIARRAYLDAAREFCKETRAWTESDVFSTAVGDGYYEVFGVDDAELWDVLRLMVDKQEVTKATYPQMMEVRGGRPKMYRINKARLHIHPEPNDDATIEGVFAFQPKRDARQIDDGILDRFGEFFEYGALSRLLAYPNKPWTSFDGAEYYRGLFRLEVDRWRSLGVDEGMIGVPRRVRKYGGY